MHHCTYQHHKANKLAMKIKFNSWKNENQDFEIFKVGEKERLRTETAQQKNINH